MRIAVLVSLGIALSGASAVAAAERGDWVLPEAGRCAAAEADARTDGDAASVALRTGAVVPLAQLASLRRHLPAPLWEHRERFFHEGMRFEIGPCFADYAPPASFASAPRPATLTSDGGLDGYERGLPFPASSIRRDAPDAGAKWAWNAAQRYQAAGFRGKFRVVDLREGAADPITYTGEIFKIDVADRLGAKPDDDLLWFAGGSFSTPFDARNFAWRQYRDRASLRDADHGDQVHAYLPQQRRVRRVSAAHVDGLYVPAFTAAALPSQQLATPGGAPGVGAGPSSGGSGGGTSANGTAGIATDVAALEAGRTGFEGLGLRPNLSQWRVVGVEDVLAPINVATPMYPATEDRSFGPSGLSLADRWDLRRALVLEARPRGAAPGNAARVVWYLDLQTLVPLYSFSYDGTEPTALSIHASRWSEDRADYPRWPDDASRPVRVLDPVGAVYANLKTDGSWRRESWDLVATPPSEAEVEHLRSLTSLERGH